MDGIHGRFDSFNSGCTQDSKAPFEGFPICSRPLEPLCAAAGEGRVEDLRRSGREGTRTRNATQRDREGRADSRLGVEESWKLLLASGRRFLSAEPYGVAVAARDIQGRGCLAA